MNSKEICIIGAGNGGSAMAGDLTLEGHRCRIFEFPEYAENIHPVISQGGIEVTGIARTGFARIALVTDEITRGFIKPYPMCRFGHPAIEAAQELIRHYPIDPEEIETVEVRTFDLAATCNEKLPKTELAAKFSVPWAVASMLVRKSSGLDDFRGESLTNSMMRAIAGRVAVVEDPRYTSMAPSKRPARVTVQTKKGSVLHREVEGSAGGPDAPLSEERLREKFRSLSDSVIGPKQAEEVTDMVLNLQELPDIRDLTRLLMPSSERQISDEELNAKFLKLASETVRRQQAEVLLDRLWHIELASDIREVMTSGRS